VIRTKRFLKHEIDDFAYGRVRNNIVSARGIANLFTHGANLLIAGGTGSGKTSFANALLDELYKSKPDLRILTIEGVAELDVMHKNYCSLLYSENDTAIGKTQVSGLLNASLRMRPDRLIVGELRSDNVSIFNRVIESGHSGTLATIHASTPEGAIDAIANNAVLAGILEFSSKEAYLGELFKSIDGVVMVKKVNHLPVVEYIEAKDIASYTNDHGNDNDNNNNIDLIGVGNAEICA
jgi:type IV secretion system protein VirB11